MYDGSFLSLQLLDFLEYHPCAFIPLIQRSLEFAVSYVFTPAGEGVTFERFIVQCMNLIKMIVKNDAYKPAKNIDGKMWVLWWIEGTWIEEKM